MGQQLGRDQGVTRSEMGRMALWSLSVVVGTMSRGTVNSARASDLVLVGDLRPRLRHLQRLFAMSQSTTAETRAAPSSTGASGRPGGSATADRGRFFEAVASHAGSAYLRYSFTRGTEQEVGFLAEALELTPAAGARRRLRPGRHAAASPSGRRRRRRRHRPRLRRPRGRARRRPPPFVRADARHLPVAPGFDAVHLAVPGRLRPRPVTTTATCSPRWPAAARPGRPGGVHRLLRLLRRALPRGHATASTPPPASTTR